ncbi:Codanin-1 [Phytophthora citrophthora]|uniref:Codanin-1 n=1 Tax=Phytophthora citrophthora TaxID=4793 RepID=A0AAD9GN10_9STRA|nr:Codanin-1 [Phytophthora citrophthora]
MAECRSDADDADAQLWAAVRGFSDAELLDVETNIRKFHCANDSGLLTGPETQISNVSISLQLGEKAERVRVDDFVHVFLDFLHRQVQVHADSRVSDDISTTTAQETSSSDMATVATFDDEFPQLSASTTIAKSTKRRITTTLLTPKDSTVVARPVPVAIPFPALGSSESTRPPAWTKRSLLEKRMMPNLSPESKSSAWEQDLPGSNAPTVWGASNSEVLKTPPTVMQIVPKKKKISGETSEAQRVQVRKKSSNQERYLQPKKKLVSNQQEDPIAPAMKKQNSEKRTDSADYQMNKQAAKLYGFLIKERFVKNTCTELQVLISLLYRADCKSCSQDDSQPESSGKTSAESPCAAISELCWRSHCLEFAETVFNEIESVVTHLGTELLELVKHSLRDAEGICQDMLERLDYESRRREELRVAESARIGCQLPVEMKASAVRDFTTPFNEETDSRLHFRTSTESLLYTNREKVRDGFLSLLRKFQQKQHSLVGIENAGVAAAAIVAARGLLAEVSLENRWWFAKFFVQELVQVGSNPFGESDKDLVLKIMKDKPDRLLKLHRRFSSQKPSNKAPQSHNSGSNNGNRVNGKGNNNSVRKNRQPVKTSNEDDATKKFTATLDRMKAYFTDNQLFFFHFLHSCDSYEFSELVKHQLERQFYAIRDPISPSSDARKDFTEVVLRLKVVAKFLGYLRFSPQWQVTSSIRGLSAHNAVFKAVEREGISTLEVARDSSLDVMQLLEASILNSSISKCIPWLCDYLSMLSLDRLSMGTTYFKQLVTLLELLYRSPRLNSLGETGLYIAMQIERIFRVLRLEGGCDYQSTDLLPSVEIRETLAGEHVATGEDQLPFLYSQVFVQSCVSELDDLRGFLQTRAQPTPRRKLSIGSSGLVVAGQPVTPIRKLRPLQVVIEDDRGVESAPSLAVPQDSSPGVKVSTASPFNFPPVQEENDKLSEAVFKVHPKLKAVVEFVVGTVTTDVCEHVIAHIVSPRADLLVGRCASDCGLTSASPLSQDAAFAARASFQVLLTSKTHHEANSTVMVALQEALQLGEERVSVAVPLFLPPSSHPTLTDSIVAVALQRTRNTLKTLVPKSSQTEFVKRVAFRNKSILKDLGSASKAASAALPSKSAEEPQTDLEEQRYRDLRRFSAGIAKSANQGPKNPSLVQWEAQVSTLSRALSDFAGPFQKAVAAGDLTHDTSPLRLSGLVMWDLVWRVISSTLKALESSVSVFASCELLSMKQKRLETVESVFREFTTCFSAFLETIVLSIGQVPLDGVAISRFQSMLEFVMDRMMQRSSDSDALTKRFGITASTIVIGKLRAAVNSLKLTQVEFNWEGCKEPPVESVTPRDLWAATAV